MINELARNEEFWSRKNMVSSTSDYRSKMEQQVKGINNNLSNVQRSIETQTFALVASQAALDHTMNQGFNQINNNLEMGFYGISNQLGYMASSLGMGLANIGNAVNIMSAQICSKLDALHDVMNNPLLTQSREKYRMAALRGKDGFFEEALESIKEALELNKTDYISWYLQGKIYLYGASQKRNVIDLDLAIESLIKAEEYNEPDSRRSDDAKRMRSEILFDLGTAQFSKSNDLLRENKKAESDEMLARAKDSFEQSFKHSNDMLESLFNLARCKAIQGETDGVVRDLETLVRRDRNYCLKVYANPDFSNIREQIDNLIKKLRKEKFMLAKKQLNKINALKSELDSLGGRTKVQIPSVFTEELAYFDIIDNADNFERDIPVLEKELADKKALLRQQEEANAEAARRADEAARQAEIQKRWAKESSEREAKEARRRIFSAVFSAVLGGIIGGGVFWGILYLSQNFGDPFIGLAILILGIVIGCLAQSVLAGIIGGVLAVIPFYFGLLFLSDMFVPLVGAVYGIIVGIITWHDRNS